MSNLIHKLNQFQHLTPDEIVSKISSQKWVNFNTLTEGEILALDGKSLYVSSDEEDAGIQINLHARNWTDCAGWDECRWWYCLPENWDGEPPCLTA